MPRLTGGVVLLVASALAPAGHVSAGTDTRSARRISLDLQDADVLGVLRLLAEVDGLNVAATDDVKGRSPCTSPAFPGIRRWRWCSAWDAWRPRATATCCA